MRAAGVAYADLGAKFGLTKDVVHRHWHGHVSDAVKSELVCGPVAREELARRAAAESMSLIDYLAWLRSKLLTLFAAGADAGERHNASAIAGRILELLQFQAKLNGELLQYTGHSTSVVNNIAIINSPEYARLQSTIISALGPFPQARAAVIAALRSAEADIDATVKSPQPILLEASRTEEADYATV
jgi:hypothetical protein